MRRLSPRLLCYNGDTVTMVQVTHVKLSRAALSSVTLSHACHESQVGVSRGSSGLRSSTPSRCHQLENRRWTVWAEDEEDIMWQHPSKRAPPRPGKMLVSLSSSNGRERISLAWQQPGAALARILPQSQVEMMMNEEEPGPGLVWINYSLFTNWRLEMYVVRDLGSIGRMREAGEGLGR